MRGYSCELSGMWLSQNKDDFMWLKFELFENDGCYRVILTINECTWLLQWVRGNLPVMPQRPHSCHVDPVTATSPQSSHVPLQFTKMSLRVQYLSLRCDMFCYLPTDSAQDGYVDGRVPAVPAEYPGCHPLHPSGLAGRHGRRPRVLLHCLHLMLHGKQRFRFIFGLQSPLYWGSAMNYH